MSDHEGVVAIRARQAALLVRPIAATVRWLTFLASGGLGFGAVYLSHQEPAQELGSARLPIAAILLSLAAAFLIDDPAAEAVASSPTPVAVVRGVRVMIAIPLLAGLWWALVLYGGVGSLGWPLTEEFAGMIVVALAIASVAARLVPDGAAGLAAAPGLLVILLSQRFVPAGWVFMPLDPISPRWYDAYGRWLITASVALVVLIAASIDPARRGVVHPVWNRVRRRVRAAEQPIRHAPEHATR